MKNSDWPELLDQLESSLTAAAAEVERHEQTLAAPILASTDATENHLAWQQALERFGDRIQEFRNCVERADSHVAAAEAALAERAAEILQYQKHVAEVRQRLENVPAATIE